MSLAEKITPAARVAMVTGSGSGVGLALTQHLLADGWDVLAVVRRSLPPLGPEVEGAQREGRLRVYSGDLSDARSRAALVATVAKAEPRIDVLFNNAGVSPGELTWSPQGRELCFEVNTLAPYVLTRGLLDTLAASGGQVVNTSSNAFMLTRRFDPASLLRPKGPYRKLFGAYASSKLALSLWTGALAPELARRGVRIVSVDPGPNSTPMSKGSGMPWPMLVLAKFIMKPPAHGAGLLAEAAAAAHPPGTFLIKGKPTNLPSAGRADEVLALVAEAARKDVPAAA
jgi:NAD(P)-dependent dehydrogenase (short-subunit alcohol dehydrogenase family)